MGGRGVDARLRLRTVDLDVVHDRHRVAVGGVDLDHRAADRAHQEAATVGVGEGELEMAHRAPEPGTPEAPLEALRRLADEPPRVGEHQCTSRIRISLPTMIIFWISDAPS